jgi:putative transposase
MRGPKPAIVELSEREREELAVLVRKHNTPQQIALRGRMILLAAEGKRNAQIARELGACTDTVRSWRMRWLGWQKLSLDDFQVA